MPEGSGRPRNTGERSLIGARLRSGACARLWVASAALAAPAVPCPVPAGAARAAARSAAIRGEADRREAGRETPADETPAGQAPRRAEQVTVTATRQPSRIEDAPASVVVLPRAALDATAAPTLDDTLRQVVGFSLFRRSGSRFANPTSQGVSLRGLGASGASRALVLVDGLPLNDPFGGWVYWARVPRLALERLEVLRGEPPTCTAAARSAGSCRRSRAHRRGHPRSTASSPRAGSARTTAPSAPPRRGVSGVHDCRDRRSARTGTCRSSRPRAGRWTSRPGRALAPATPRSSAGSARAACSRERPPTARSAATARHCRRTTPECSSLRSAPTGARPGAARGRHARGDSPSCTTRPSPPWPRTARART